MVPLLREEYIKSFFLGKVFGLANLLCVIVMIW